jgi:hypothetical protein
MDIPLQPNRNQTTPRAAVGRVVATGPTHPFFIQAQSFPHRLRPRDGARPRSQPSRPNGRPEGK